MNIHDAAGGVLTLAMSDQFQILGPNSIMLGETLSPVLKARLKAIQASVARLFRRNHKDKYFC